MSDPRLTRRELLRRGAGAVATAGAALAAGYALHERGGRKRPLPAVRLPDFFARVDFPPANPRLSVTIGADAHVDEMVRTAVNGLNPAGGIRRFVTAGDVVLIKPNAGFDRPPHLGATTNPEVLRALIRLCRQAGAREVLITDHPIEAPAACFARSGIQDMAQAEGARIWWPRADDFAAVEALSGGRAWPMLYAPLARATKLIGVAPVKDHNLARASIVLKNWYGLLGGRRHQFHQAVHEAISDLAALISPTFVVADATRVMLRNGPTGGRSSDVQPGGVLGQPAIIAAVDPVACDAWCYENCLGRDPAGLHYLALAQRKIADLGSSRFGECDWRAYERRGQIAEHRL